MKTKLVLIAVACLLHGLTTLAVAQNDTVPNFWFLEQGTEPTAENRINAIKNVGRGLLDFAIYQPTGNTFSEEYRQKLLDAGFVFDFLATIQTQNDHGWTIYPPVGLIKALVIPETVSLPVEEFLRPRRADFAFLGKAPELPESMERGLTTFVDRKNEIATERQRMRERLAASPTSDGRIRTEEEIEAVLRMVPMPPALGLPVSQRPIGMEQIDENLDEALRMGWGYLRIHPEIFVTETGVELLARRELLQTGTTDVFYVFANTKENAETIDGWFRMGELKYGRTLITYSGRDGTGGRITAEHDRALIMDPATGKIGFAAVRDERVNPPLRIRIQMKPGETLIVRIVRDRTRGRGGADFQEFETLPAWEYEGDVPEPPGR